MKAESTVSKPAHKPSVINQKTFGIFSLSLRDDGILHRHVSARGEYKMSDLPELNSIIGEMVNYDPVPVMVTIDESVTVPFEAREVMAQKSGSPYSKAVAYVTKQLAHQLIASFHININKPERPTRLFDNEEEAVEWLKTFLPSN